MLRSCISKKRLGQRVLGLSLLFAAPFAFAAPAIDVHSDPNCGCCGAWVAHLEENGFDVNHHRDGDVRQVKIEQGVTPKLASCHTAIIDGYVIEGHVPADDIKALLDERPDVAGLAVPGMPHGSPGMETGRVDDFAVLSFTRDDRAPEIFREYTQ